MASVSNISLYIRRFTHLEEMALVIPGLEKRTGYDPVNLIEMDVLNNHRYRSDVMLWPWRHMWLWCHSKETTFRNSILRMSRKTGDLGGVWHSPGMPETGIQYPTLNFSVPQNLLLHLAPDYRIHWSICVVKAWGHAFPGGGGEYHSTQISWWSSGYDTCLECERPGVNPPLRL